MQFILALSGLPAAGKSTWAREWCKRHGWTHVEFDASHPEWHAPKLNLPDVEYKTARREMLQLVRERVKRGETVVVDDNCLLRSMRHEIWQIAASGTCANFCIDTYRTRWIRSLALCHRHE